MRVWLIDSQLERAVAAELVAITDEHLEQANQMWLPEFQRRKSWQEKDEDSLWPWPLKAKDMLGNSVETRGYVVTLSGAVEGIVLLLRAAEPSRLAPGARVLYVCYAATAPWNRRAVAAKPYSQGAAVAQVSNLASSSAGIGGLEPCPTSYRGVGTLLMAHAVQESVTGGHAGRVGLHSLKAADAFYRKLRFHDFGPDPARRGLTYFELDSATAAWLLDVARGMHGQAHNLLD